MSGWILAGAYIGMVVFLVIRVVIHERRARKMMERRSELVKYEAESLRDEILLYADGKISHEKAELLAYKCVAGLDLGNQAEMSVPTDVRAALIVNRFLAGNIGKDKASDEFAWLRIRERKIGKQLMIVRMMRSEAETAGVPNFSRSDIARWSNLEKDGVDELVAMAVVLNTDNLYVEAAKEYADNHSVGEYEPYIELFRKYGLGYVDYKLDLADFDISVEAKSKLVADFIDALGSFFNFYIGRIALASNKGYSQEVIREMLQETDDNRFAKICEYLTFQRLI